MKHDSIEVLGCRIDVVDMDQALARIGDFVRRGGVHHVITLNAEIIYQAQKNSALRNLINRADLVTPDGIGVLWGSKILGCHIPERVTGIDLLEHLCDQAAQQGWKLFLLGAAPGVAEQAGSVLCQRYPGLELAGYKHGYFTEDDVPALLAEIERCRPDVLAVALGAPRQEFFISCYKDLLKIPVCIGVGGSLDVIAGIKQRAPHWMIRLNLEWLYRLISEPQRWRRQLALPKFMFLIIKNRRHSRNII